MQLTTDDKEGEKPITKATVQTLKGNGKVDEEIECSREPQVFSLGPGKKIEPPAVRPNQSLFEVDTGMAWIECGGCKRAFQVYINATFSSVAALPRMSVTAAMHRYNC